MNEIEVNSKPRRAQGGKGLLSRSISVQKPQESIPLIPREEREEEEQGEGENHGRRGRLCSGARERERVREYLCPLTLGQKTKLPLDLIIH